MDAAAFQQACKLADKGRELTEKIASLEANKKDVAQGTTWISVEFGNTTRLTLANTAFGPGDEVLIGRLQRAICKVLDELITELQEELRQL